MSAEAVNEYAATLIGAYRRRGLLLDANLLLVYAVGLCDRRLLGNSARLDEYTEEDFDLLVRLIGLFDRVVTMPNILTEVSNLATSALARNRHHGYLVELARVIHALVELTPESKAVARLPVFTRLALTDAGIEHVARDEYLVVSADLNLVNHLQNEKIAVINVNHLRDLVWEWGAG